ncbi:MAG: pyruvate formate lyase family protein [Eubacteriales bacterium]|jgi:pyruvate-formate lyase
MDFTANRAALYQEMDAVYRTYPTDTAALREKYDVQSARLSPYGRKLLLYRIAIRNCPVHIFPHCPFYYEMDVGKNRNAWMGGFCNYVRETSDVDMTDFHARMKDRNMRNLTMGGSFADFDHRVPGYDNLLRGGLRGLCKEAERLNVTEPDADRRMYRETLIETAHLLRELACRYADEAARQASGHTGEVRDNLMRIADAARRIPWEKPATFYEAMCAILFTRESMNALEGVGISSYGHLDRMLYPYFVRDLAEGRITREEAYSLLCFMLSLTDGRFEYIPGAHIETSTTVMIGGQDADGTPVYNELTDMIIDAFAEHRFVNPKLNARVCMGSPDAYLEKLAQLLLTGSNVLAIENDEVNIRYLQNAGVSERDARLYVGCGCQELTVQNTAYHSRAFLYVNLVQILLDTLTKHPHAAFDELYAAYFTALRDFLGELIADCTPFDAVHVQVNAEPFVSLLLSDCIGRGKDVTEGGARYRFKTFTLVGFGTLADSLLALREYPDRTALLEGMRRDYAEMEPLRRSLENLPKYGDPDVRPFIRTLAHDLSHAADGWTAPGDVPWGTSIFTYWAYGSFGNRTSATPDGRHAGIPFTRGGGPSDVALARFGVTAGAQACGDTCADFTDTSVYDFTLPYSPGTVDPDTLAAYIRACIGLNVPVLQCMTVDKEQLIEERDHPGTHPELVVRVCGYSARFGLLRRPVQDEVISRFANRI